MRIYVASSWRNPHQQEVVRVLRGANPGNEVYDFRDSDGFSWDQISPDWKNWTPRQYSEALEHPLAVAGHTRDLQTLLHSNATILVLPAGRSASWELGFAMAKHQKCAVLALEPCEPELMFRGAKFLFSKEELRRWGQCLNKEAPEKSGKYPLTRLALFVAEEWIGKQWLSLGNPDNDLEYHVSKASSIHRITTHTTRVIDLHTHQVYWHSDNPSQINSQ